MTSQLFHPAWASFGPAKGSAAFTATPGPSTPSTERKNHFDLSLRFEHDGVSGGSSDRSDSADSAATLVERYSSHEGQAAPPTPPSGVEAPSIDGSNRGIIPVLGPSQGVSTPPQWQWAMTDRELYHRLQNYDRFPDALALARRRILNEMDHLLSHADELSQDPNHIFSLPQRFDQDAFRDYLTRIHDATTDKFAQYDARRAEAYSKAKADGATHSQAATAGMEMFQDGREAAKRWLQRASVVKYVDGAWLQHLLRNSTGATNPDREHDVRGADDESRHRRSSWLRQQRRAARAAWQVMSEELGDGDLSRSHVAIYESNMDDLAREDKQPLPPKGEDRAFTEWSGVAGPGGETPDGQDSEGNARCWRSALSQLALSVSPNEFLPESIGWNASYEGLPYHLLVSSRELQEHKLNAYYFWLHISIDNASSGHAAMARECVVDLVEAAKEAKGQDFADEIWARVKLGFALADGIPTTPLRDHEVDDTPYELTWTAITESDVNSLPAIVAKSDDASTKADEEARLGRAVVEILRTKSSTAHGLHAGVKARFAGEKLSYWLDPAHIDVRAPELLEALASNPIWIVRGKPNESKFVKEFEWGGKMFGAMTGGEVETLRKWVASLPPAESSDDKKASKAEDVVSLATDDAAEANARGALAGWLKDQLQTKGSQPISTFASADWLRPAAVEAPSTAGWDDFVGDFATKLYKSCMQRPDAVHSLPRDVDSLLNSLDSTAEGDPLVSLTSEDMTTSSTLDVLRSSSPPLSPSATSTEKITALLPILANLSTPLEQLVSLSPGRLASPLGMAGIKVLRILHAFTETSDPTTQATNGGDGRDVGCMGTDDSERPPEGLWEVLDAWTTSTNPSGETLQLSNFVDRPSNQLALPALLIALSSHFWTMAPTLLGMSLFLVTQVSTEQSLLDSLAAAQTSSHSVEQEKQRLKSMFNSAAAWLERAVEIGVEAEKEGQLPRGVTLAKGRTWSMDVQRGWRIAKQGWKRAVVA